MFLTIKKNMTDQESKETTALELVDAGVGKTFQILPSCFLDL